ncbi:hypothetical protein IYX23_04200 [Methylocystis sp. L43]|jgi:hypothetical protein|uniref:hypothetical protein n=1 Tax=unclassified Methylocystis TaxID=2625913 RepID=UPI0018C1D5CE|nr:MULTISPECIES: hypothetical protein [unclassified Methylocystis]MBG0796895.1 hypothetical protein [Methylocystis sp. L43]MBG0806182.1 hypothetical protein [Methylocystis sp. H15]
MNDSLPHKVFPPTAFFVSKKPDAQQIRKTKRNIAFFDTFASVRAKKNVRSKRPRERSI